MSLQVEGCKTIKPLHQAEAPAVQKSNKYQIGIGCLAVAGLVVAVVGTLGFFGIGIASLALNICILATGGIITAVALAILCKSKETDTPSSTLQTTVTSQIEDSKQETSTKKPLKDPKSTTSKTQPKQNGTTATIAKPKDSIDQPIQNATADAKSQSITIKVTPPAGSKEEKKSSTASASKDKEPLGSIERPKDDKPKQDTSPTPKPVTIAAPLVQPKEEKKDTQSSTASASKDKEPPGSIERPKDDKPKQDTSSTKPQNVTITATVVQPKEEKKVPKEDPLAKLSSSQLWEHIHNILPAFAQSQFNSGVNHRFYNIPCLSPAIQIEGRHIHANKVGHGLTDKAIVASQAPHAYDLESFWRGIFNNPHAIIDLTTPQDIKDKKAQVYYPTEAQKTLTAGSLTITFIKETNGIINYGITDAKSNMSKKAQRYHYKTWIDCTAVDLVHLQSLVALLNGPLKDLPFWIHCAAGIGRTGTLIAAYILREKILKGEITRENFKSSLVDIVLTLKKQRWGSVQRFEQFDLLCQFGEALLAEVEKKA